MKRQAMLWALIVLCSTLYQTFIKIVADEMGGIDFSAVWIQQAAGTPSMWAALASEIAAFVVWMHILSDHDLSRAFPISAISYVLILCVGWFAFHEDMLPLQIIGSALILLGAWMIGTAGAHKEPAS